MHCLYVKHFKNFFMFFFKIFYINIPLNLREVRNYFPNETANLTTVYYQFSFNTLHIYTLKILANNNCVHNHKKISQHEAINHLLLNNCFS